MTGCLANSTQVGASESVPLAMLKGGGSRFPPEAVVPAEGLVSGTTHASHFNTRTVRDKVENPPSKGCDRRPGFLPRKLQYTFS